MQSFQCPHTGLFIVHYFTCALIWPLFQNPLLCRKECVVCLFVCFQTLIQQNTILILFSSSILRYFQAPLRFALLVRSFQCSLIIYLCRELVIECMALQVLSTHCTTETHQHSLSLAFLHKLSPYANAL